MSLIFKSLFQQLTLDKTKKSEEKMDQDKNLGRNLKFYDFCRKKDFGIYP